MRALGRAGGTGTVLGIHSTARRRRRSATSSCRVATSGRTGFNWQPLGVVSRGPWSVLTRCAVPSWTPWGPPGPHRSGWGDLGSKRPSATGRRLLLDTRPSQSTSSRLMPACRMRSAARNWSGMSRGTRAGASCRAVVGVRAEATRLMASTPQAMPTSMDRRDQVIDEIVGLLRRAHWQSTVVAAPRREALGSQAVRVTLEACSPAG